MMGEDVVGLWVWDAEGKVRVIRRRGGRFNTYGLLLAIAAADLRRRGWGPCTLADCGINFVRVRARIIRPRAAYYYGVPKKITTGRAAINWVSECVAPILAQKKNNTTLS